VRVDAFEGVPEQVLHDLRESATLTKGWLQILFRRWESLREDERRQMVAAALFGAHKLGYVLDGEPEEVRLPHEALAEEYFRLVES